MKSNLEELPTFSKSHCPICKKVKPLKCDDCGINLPTLPEMGKNGYQSHTSTHLHFSVNHPGLRNPCLRKLCPACYIIDFKLAYPDEPCPITVPSL